MKGTITLIKPDGSETVTEVTTKPTLETMQTLVGGYIELLAALTTFKRQPCYAFINEEGKFDLTKFPRNEKATALQQFTGAYFADDFIAGNLLIFTGDDAFMRSFHDDE